MRNILGFLLACAFQTIGIVALAAEKSPELVNGGFEQYDASSGMPTGWRADGAAHQVRVECTPGCALRLASSSPVKADDSSSVWQELPLAGVAGHKLVLSGFIRTEKLGIGTATPFLTVNRSINTIAVADLDRKAPTGTTPWTPFEVSVLVPPNASAVFAGVGIKGEGVTWFRQLSLRVDESVTVPPYQPQIPPRPVPTQDLLDNAALRLPAEDVAQVPAIWRDDVLARRQVIRSLFSDDFSDLQFLKPLLAGKRVVQLGESGHGVAEFNWVKARLIRFLHQQMGFDVLAFESSLDQCYEADRIASTVEAATVLQHCIFDIWRNQEVATVFDYIGKTRKSAHPLTLAGFDIQDSAGVDGTRLTRMMTMLDVIDAKLAAQLEDMETRLRTSKRPLSDDVAGPLQTYYRQVAALLSANQGRLLANGIKPEELNVSLQAAQSRIRYVQQLSSTEFSKGMAIRDEGMANNLDFLLDTLYPKRKVIVWAHNAHIAKSNSADSPKLMGQWVAQRRGGEVYTIGLFMNRGAAHLIDHTPYQIHPATSNTLEAVLANGGVKYAFVDFSTAKRGKGTEWIFESLGARDWGIQPIQFTPADTYDAVIYIDTVTPPQLL